MIAFHKPFHNSYLLCMCDEGSYVKFCIGYSRAKKYGIRCIYGFLAGSSVSEIYKEINKGSVRKWGRVKIGTIIISTFFYITTLTVPFITKTSTIIKLAKSIHTTIAVIAELCEDMTNMAYIPLDLLICGQLIPVGVEGRFNIMGKSSNLFD